MKKLIYGVLSLAIVGIGVVGCKKENSKSPAISEISNQPSLEFFTLNFSEGELSRIYGAYTTKLKAKPKKWKFSFTYGGFEHCAGGANCGSCIGICIQRVGVARLDHLTEEEELNGDGLAEIIFDDNNQSLLFFYPDRPIDNGDGYVRIDSDFDFGEDINNHFGREIIIQSGAYQIHYSSSFPNGVAVFNVR